MEELTITKYIYDYSEILRVYGVPYFPVDYYWQVGEVKQTQGWVIHLSVIRTQLQEILQAIIPTLLTKNLPFRVARDASIAFNLLEGGFGYKILGKLICIYPRNEEEAPIIAKWLLEHTTSFRGPGIPTDRHLGGIVYTRYGSINPVLVKDSSGEWVKHIYDVHGQLIPDPYMIPFSLPEGISWPYLDMVSLDKVKRSKLLNYKYYPLFVLKPDAKGDVIRGLYFKRPWQIKSCLIKQGRPNMFADDYGRDIQNRLKWQYELYLALHEDIPMPQVFDYFEDHGNTYLAMEFIKGQTLTSWISSIYEDRSWLNLNLPERLQLLNKLLDVISIIKRVHKKGYIHRDITPENFLVDKRDGIFLIDMELTWSAIAEPSQPPFQLGTPGHMSPEQMAALVPTTMQDAYGLGSLVFAFLSNLYALKLIGQPVQKLIRSLEFFIGDSTVAHCIAACWSDVPSERPLLDNIENTLRDYREKLNREDLLKLKNPKSEFTLDPSEIRGVIQGGLNYLASPALLSPKSRWVSQSLQKEKHIGNQQVGVAIYEGWHTGMAGPLWLIAQAKKLGFAIEACQTPYVQSWDYIEQNYFGKMDKVSAGLYAGNAGIALALMEGLNNSLLEPNLSMLEKLQVCFLQPAALPNLAEGVSGQGLALLQCSSWLDKKFSQKTLTSYVQKLIQNQQPDGSWNIYTGIDHGTAGIVLFILSYIEKYPDDNAKSSAIKALGWLEKIGKKGENIYSWPISTSTKIIDRWSFSIGNPGIALAFIKAYDILRVPHYRRIAEYCLTAIAPNPVILDFSLGSGFAGLGDIYLEAFRVFKNPIWQEKANWIAAILLHCYKKVESDSGHWLTTISEITTADLFFGNGGIVYFLMRFLYPEKIKHAFNIDHI